LLVLALDACAPTHAKGLGSDSSGLTGLGILDLCALDGVRFVTTTGVFGELVTMSLHATLQQWLDNGTLSTEPALARSVRAFDNTIPKRVPRPGRHDRALVYASRTVGAFLLTHDTGAAGYARAAKVATVDMLDLGRLLMERSQTTIAALEAVFSRFNDPGSYRPSDWAGSVQSTLLARPHSGDLTAELQARLNPQATPRRAPHSL